MESQPRKASRGAFVLDICKLKIIDRLGNPVILDLPTIDRELQTSAIEFLKNRDDIIRFLIGSTSLRHHLRAGYREIHVPTSCQNENQAFLALLEQYLPNYIFCNICKRLHNVDSRYIKGKHRNWECRMKDAKNFGDLFIYPGFRYPIFQFAMKRARAGRNYQKLLDALTYKHVTYEDSHTHMCAATPRIVDESFLVRVQHIVVALPGETDLPTDAKVAICPHYDALEVRPESFEAFSVKAELIISVNWYSQTSESEDWLLESRLFHCPHCTTEVQIDVKRYGESRALIFTKWQDLGKGIDADDIVYRTHLYSPHAHPLGLGFDNLWWNQMPRLDDEQKRLTETRWSETRILRKAYPYSKVGSIRSKFGDGKDFVSDSLLAEVPKPGKPANSPRKSILRLKNIRRIFGVTDRSPRMDDGSKEESCCGSESHGFNHKGRPPPYSE